MAQLTTRMGLIAAALFLAGANPPGPPWTLAASPDAIVLRWYPDSTSQAEADLAASAHCAISGRAAGFQSMEQDGSAEIASYRCW